MKKLFALTVLAAFFVVPVMAQEGKKKLLNKRRKNGKKTRCRTKKSGKKI